MVYDSTKDTLEHIQQVRLQIRDFNDKMTVRGIEHDKSKLQSPEKEGFDSVGERLRTLKYGSDEYKQSLDDLKPTLDHHYANNSHHPQYYTNGIDGMDLYDIIEMYCDWQAAVKRTKDGDISKSIDINEKRFGMSGQLANIFKNTVNK